MKPGLVAFSHESALYGAPRSLLLALEAAAARWDVLLVATEPGGLVDRAREAGIETRIVPRTGIAGGLAPAARLAYARRLIALLKERRPRAAYVNTLAHATPLFAARRAGVPALLHVREHEGWFRPRTAKGRFRLRRLLRDPARIACVSDATRRLVLAAGADAERTRVVYNGVDLERFVPDGDRRNRRRAELGLARHDVVVGFVGQLTARKGWDLLLEATALLARRAPGAALVVVGGAPGEADEEAFAACVRRLGLDDRVRRVPFADDVRADYDAMDVFVCPSRAEPFARVNLEAMAMALPVVATRTGGNPEAVEDGVTGLLVPIEDPAALAEALAGLAADPARRRRLGAAGRARAGERFGLERYRAAVLALLDEVAAS